MAWLKKFRKKFEGVKLLLGLSNQDGFYDDEEIVRLARLPIESSLPLISQLVISAASVLGEYRENGNQESEDKKRFQKQNA